MKEYYKYEYFWRRGDGDEDYSPHDRDDGTIDLIVNTVLEILRQDDVSDWAHTSFHACAELLQQRKRYPDIFISEHEVTFWFTYWIRRPFRKLAARLDIPLKPLYRSQDDMTRDSYIALGALYEHLMQFADVVQARKLTEDFKKTTIPRRLYSADTFRWYRRLKEDNRDHFKIRLTYLKHSAGTKHFERTNKLWLND